AMHESKEKTLTIKTYSDDDFIYIEISDTGCGIPETDIPNLFTPFYTTKPSYIEEGTKRPKGTGLGLFSTYQILKPYGVKFYVESEVGKGTTFKIKIPIQ
ncbi:MAG: ATP-binding protein, partial [Candidatus Marinimicrobia bacterium]|nr:ATP-binding protein [Candidatus Neomarinimicrobiota bacterium]